jgi:tetratricopeptide (TPR) repeat protein
MDREEYLRLLNRGFTLAFRDGALREGAACYAEALRSLAPGELAYADHHGEYAAVLMALGQEDEALSESARAMESAERGASGFDVPEVTLHRCLHAERLLAVSRPADALQTITPVLTSGGAVEPSLLIVKAKALSALGRLAEAQEAARDALRSASSADRAVVRERLDALLGGFAAG